MGEALHGGRASGGVPAVLRPGAISAGDPVAVTARPEHGVTIGDVFPSAQAPVMKRLLAGAEADAIELSPPLASGRGARSATRSARRSAPACARRPGGDHGRECLAPSRMARRPGRRRVAGVGERRGG